MSGLPASREQLNHHTHATATETEFVLWTPTFGQPCTVGVTVGWRNLDSGEAGSFTSVVRGNATFQTGSQELDLPTGPGRIVLSLTTDRPHLPVADIEIAVP